MFDELIVDLQSACNALEESEEVKDYLRVQELLSDIEYNAHKLIVVYID